MLENGEPGDPHTQAIVIRYDHKTQAVSVTWDNQEYRTFEMLLGVMEMGRLQLETMRNVALSQNMQRAQMLAMQEQQALKGIMLGK